MVTVSAPSIASGDTVRLQLRAIDASGRPLKAGGSKVAFQATGGVSRGFISPATDRNDGTYSAFFVGVVAGPATTIGASIDGAQVVTPLPTIRVTPGAFSPSTSTLHVTPRTIVAGGKALLELITRDAAGNRLDKGGLRVVLSVRGGSATGTVGPVTDHGDGRYTATFTASSVGTPLEVGATVNGTPVTAPPATVSVARGLSPDLSVLSVSSDTVTIDGGVRVTLEVRDSANVRRQSGGDTVQFSTSGGAGTSAGTFGSVRDHGDGSYSATFTATHAGGPVAIGAMLNGRQKTTGLPLITVLGVPATAQQSSVRVSADTVRAGESATLTAQLRSINGVPITGAASRVRFVLGGGGSSSGAIGTTREDGGGEYTATFTGKVAGTPVTIGATLDDSTQVQMLDSLGNSHLPSITVVAASVSADSAVLVADPASVNVGDTTQVRLVMRDRFGNMIATGGRVVAFSRTGGAGVSAGTLGPVTDHGDGRYTARYRADSAGLPDTVRASVDGQAVSAHATISVSPACVAGPFSAEVSDVTINENSPAQRPRKNLVLPSGVSSTLTLLLQDARKCPVTQSRRVEFRSSGGSSTGAIGPVVNLRDGRYTATYTGHIAGTATTIMATVDGQPVTSPPVAVVVVPGDISPRTSTLTSTATSLTAGDSVRITLRARDAAGNDIRTGGRMITFFVTGTDAGGTMGATADHGDGTYSALYRAVTGGRTDVIVAVIEGTRVAHAVTLSVLPP